MEAQLLLFSYSRLPGNFLEISGNLQGEVKRLKEEGDDREDNERDRMNDEADVRGVDR